MAGGLGNKKEFLSDTVVLDTGDEHWMRPVPVGDLNPGARAFHAGCAVGSRVYIFGGSWSPRNRYQADLWCLDTDDWRWTMMETTNQPQPRDFPTLVHVGDNLIVLYGGYSGTKFMSDIHVLDVTTGVWREIQAEGFGAQQPQPRSGHAAAVVAHRLAVLGGETTGNTMLSDLWTLRGLQGDGPLRWTKLSFKGQPPSARGAHAIADMGTKLVIFGGHGEEGFLQRRSVYYGDIHVLDREPESGPQWVRVTVPGDAKPEGRAYHTFTEVRGQRALLFGGCNGTHRATYGDAWWLLLDESAGSEDDREPDSPPAAGEPETQLPPHGNQYLPTLAEEPPHPAAAVGGRVVAARTSPAAAVVKDVQQPAVPPAADPSIARGQVGPHAANEPQNKPASVHEKRSMRLSEAQQIARAAEQAAALEDLRLDLGLPRQSRAESLTDDKEHHTLLTLGRRELAKHSGVAPGSAEQSQCIVAARTFLSQVEPKALQLGDVKALLSDYDLSLPRAYHATTGARGLTTSSGALLSAWRVQDVFCTSQPPNCECLTSSPWLLTTGAWLQRNGILDMQGAAATKPWSTGS
eukprot:CAMPEP_0117669726 /NCGR_PEP_ID=MMETSP0804-20121206/12308_1 /TAXON_ID=1074897 /ORGANISM="Tetraselmis astigmatica, Strain CCMP880" /LENGTH=576 /DNA_ID=CAMNT_0005477847 /DNA_START=314 /DNA_END=2045 /DNA_ORIENTATION=+